MPWIRDESRTTSGDLGALDEIRPAVAARILLFPGGFSVNSKTIILSFKGTNGEGKKTY